MNGNADAPIDRLERGYDELAARADADLDRRASPWGDSHFQRHYSWPATERVLPEVADRSVLLAGCGRGDHVPWFRERGATVTGVDASETAVRDARERFGDEATFHRADLTTSLAFADGAFDLVVSNLVLSHVEEWEPVFEEFRRVLDSRGHLVVTTVHPRYLRSIADVDRYDAVVETTNEWPGGVELPTFYRPTSAVVTPFVASGFRLEAFDEPTPTPAFETHYPERYERALREPELLVIRARAA